MFFMPMLIGAALGGGISALRGGDPLKGALMGAAGGALGGATGLLGAGTGTTAAATGAAATGGGYGSLGIAGHTALQGAGSTAGGVGSGLFGNTMAGIGRDFGALQSFAQKNPMQAAQLGGQAMNMIFPPQQPMPQVQAPGIMRGQQMQQQPMQFDMQAPQISLI